MVGQCCCEVHEGRAARVNKPNENSVPLTDDLVTVKDIAAWLVISEQSARNRVNRYELQPTATKHNGRPGPPVKLYKRHEVEAKLGERVVMFDMKPCSHCGGTGIEEPVK